MSLFIYKRIIYLKLKVFYKITGLTMDKKYIYWQSPESIQLLTETLNNNEVFIGSSDTVIGLFANITSKGYQKLGQIKKRVEKPYIVLIDSPKKIFNLAELPSDKKFINFINNCWPGPVTLIFKAKENLPTFLKSSDNTIAIRIPNHPQLHKLLSHFSGLFSTSANISGEKIPQTIEEINSEIVNYVQYIVSDKNKTGLVPSTILDCTGDRIRVIREGAYLIEDLEKFYGQSFIK